MKLDQSMVGKKVKGVQWPKGEWLQIEWGRANLFAGFTNEGVQHAYKSDEYCWELVECQCKDRTPGGIIKCCQTLKHCSECGEKIVMESPKLPSERITEIIGNRATGATMGGQSVTEQAIIQYLDEEAKKK